MEKTILLTGCAGFIGMNVGAALLARGSRVIGVDNLTPYYSVKLKQDRLSRLKHPNFKFYQQDISEFDAMKKIFEDEKPDQVCHLAAQAGVRYSLENPFAYIKSNVDAYLNLIEIMKNGEYGNIVYASSSSVYGANTKTPFSVEDRVDSPISLYAATKRTNELFAYVYNNLYGLKSTGLRFFTVYGPWGRPDMACYKFALLSMNNKPIEVYNNGEMHRDFTFIDDIVSGVIAALDHPFDLEVFNLGNSNTVRLGYFIEVIEQLMGRKFEKNLLPLQMGDVVATSADIDKSREMLGFSPKTNIEDGLRRFFEWFHEYHADELKALKQ